MTDQFKVFTDQQKQLLDQSLDQRLVSERKGGSSTMLKYIEGHDAIDQANRIFGYGNWGARPLFCEMHVLRDPLTDQPIGVTYKAQVELTVRGCIIPIVEVGSQPVATWNLKDYLDSRRKKDDKRPIEEWEKTLGARIITEAHEMAEKGAVTDALKRALRTFGNQFGNGLYGDGQVHFNESDPGTSPSSSKASVPPVAAVPTRPTPVPVQQQAQAQRTEPKKEKMATSEQITLISEKFDQLAGLYEWKHIVSLAKLPEDTKLWTFDQATSFLERFEKWGGSEAQRTWLTQPALAKQMEDIKRFGTKEMYGSTAVRGLKGRIDSLKDTLSDKFTAAQADTFLDYLYAAKETIELAKQVDPENKIATSFEGVTHPLDFYASERDLDSYLKRLAQVEKEQQAKQAA